MQSLRCCASCLPLGQYGVDATNRVRNSYGRRCGETARDNEKLTTYPRNCHFPRSEPLGSARKWVWKAPLDFRMAEAWLWLSAGRSVPVRLSGQDARPRLSTIVILADRYGTEKEYCRFAIKPGQAWFEAYNSILSEARFGLEYGFSVTSLTAFTLWEAQFVTLLTAHRSSSINLMWPAKTSGLALRLVMLLAARLEGQGPTFQRTH